MPVKFDRSLIPPSPDLAFERALWDRGVVKVAGVDEAGRGALAGPVAAAAVVFPVEADLMLRLSGVRDSKQMTPLQRENWASKIKDCCLSSGVGLASAQEIDDLGIVLATRLAIQRALEKLPEPPEHLLVDYIELPGCSSPLTALVKGDARVLSIAAASVLAKTARDSWMAEIDQVYPGYGFALHKGYGTQAHREAIQRNGLSPIHRITFRFKDPPPTFA